MREKIVKGELEVARKKIKLQEEKMKRTNTRLKEMLYYILDNRKGNEIDTNELISMLKEMI